MNTTAAMLSLATLLAVSAAWSGAAPGSAHALTRCDLRSFRAGDRWHGSYTCSQGRTELTLVIGGIRGTAVDAIFRFDWRAGGIRGAFAMSGAFEAARCALRLHAVRWISQPRDWVMVGLDGVLSPDGSTYSGRIVDTESPSCTTFSVRRP